MADKVTKPKTEKKKPEVVKAVVEKVVAKIAAPTTTESTSKAATTGGDYKRGQKSRSAGGRKPRDKRNRRRDEEDDGFDNRMIKIRRVSRMYKGGRRLRMSVAMVVGDKKGQVGYGIGKGVDVGQAQRKGVEKAKSNLITVSLKGNTIAHDVEYKYKATRVILKPAAPGTGIVAGSAVKAVLEMAGVKDALTKVLGSTNKLNVTRGTIEALKSLRSTKL